MVPQLDFLRQGSWFAGLPGDLQQQIVVRSVVQSYGRGQVISRQGVASKGLFAVLEGQVRAVRDLDAASPAVFYAAGAGFWFGEISVLAGLPAAVTFIAAGRVSLLLLPTRHFTQIVDDNPCYYRDFARLAIERYAVLIRQNVELAVLDAEARLRSRLVGLAELRRLDRGDGESRVISIPQGELAQMIGVSRQHLNRMLRQLEASGVIAMPPRRIVILDVERLRAPVAPERAIVGRLNTPSGRA